MKGSGKRLNISATHCGVSGLRVEDFSHLSKTSIMTRLGLAVVAGSLMLGSSLVASETTSPENASSSFALYHPGIFNTVDGSTLLRRLPVRDFLDGTRLPFSTALGRMGAAPVEFPPIMFADLAEVKTRTRSPRADGKDYSDGKESSQQLMVSQSSPIHFGGELGVFYGQYSGKYEGDAFGTYLQGTVGNDHFQLSVGAEHQEWNTRLSHGRH